MISEAIAGMSDWTLIAIVSILSVSTTLAVLEFSGLLPPFIVKYLAKSRLQPTLLVLDELGIDTKRVRRDLDTSRIPVYIDARNLTDSTKKLLNNCTINGECFVGKTTQVKVDKFIDVMGLSVSPDSAVELARALAAKWREHVARTESSDSTRFDVVVGCKSGAPFIAYEFAKLMDRPIILHNDFPKFRSGELQYNAVFDSSIPIPRRKVALIVDDSTTGGRKVAAIIDDLRRFEINVRNCCVIFEPSVKGARNLIESKGVILHSICRT